MEKYKEYKDSDIIWFNQIPKHWETFRFIDNVYLKHGYQFRDYDFTNEGIRIIKISQLNPKGYLELEKSSFIDAKRLDSFKSIVIQKGDILMALTGGTIGKIVRVDEINEPLLQNYRVGNFFPDKNKLDKDFLYFLLSSKLTKEQIDYLLNRNGQPNIGKESFKSMFFTLPPIKEQTQIANYLDAKTKVIDQKIKLLQQKIIHYKAYRKSLINETVTKGLDKSVKLKDSGVEWIGEIPAHWEVKRLKSLGEISTSSVNKKIEEDQKMISLVNYTDVFKNLNKEIWNNFNFMRVTAKANQIFQKNLKKGDVLFTPSSETAEDIGVSSVVMEDLKNTLYSYHLLRLRFSQEIYDKFKKYMFNNDFVQYYFSKSAKGTTRKILGLNDFNNLQIILPNSVKEQQQIADFLDTKTSTIDKIVKNIETQISTLKELRKTLINEVVTGKVKVVK
ncbi:restriction endonuclease subunit S [Psychroflexus salis]|uniref:Type I restriction endonuclease subunit S n=1 Tax=Psychroflexus salis TaxID=1526574 RepID=A0A917EA11_9FLAO|nr:restriction endonuclease subunit S [Psychroflexus salis]GGE15406.1 type I restriction endonuclease subunit S [Psychroflexus salis]